MFTALPAIEMIVLFEPRVALLTTAWRRASRMALTSACPLDIWRAALAPAGIGGAIEKIARQFFMTSPPKRAEAYLTMRNSGNARLADATLRLVLRHWRADGYTDTVAQLVDRAWDAGSRDPEVAETRAINLAAGGREADLAEGAAVCAQTLPLRGGSTDDAWRLLEIRQAQILGQIERRRIRYSDLVDEDGNPIPKRRHHPAKPHRVRQPRFLRVTVSG